MHCPTDTGDDAGICATELTYDDHGRYVKSPLGEDRHGTALRERFDAAALRFDCPECGVALWTCPVCTDHLLDDPDGRTCSASGWFIGESTGVRIACHNCNQREAMRQTRETRAGRGGRF